MSDRYAWSTDEENYEGPLDSIEEAFDEAAELPLDPEDFGGTVNIGVVYYPRAESYVNAGLVIDHITQQDEYGIDAAEGWPHASKGQLAELTRLLQQTVGDWLDRHKLRERFFLVRDVKRYERVNGRVVEMKGGGA